jgi:hypothetical protein
MNSLRIQPVLVALCLANLGLGVFLLVKVRGVEAMRDGAILRGKALQIVDDEGRVRASISVLPKDEKYRTPEGGPWPETVLLRLITADGRPNVKLAATERGSGLMIGGKTDPTYIQINSEIRR